MNKMALNNNFSYPLKNNLFPLIMCIFVFLVFMICLGQIVLAVSEFEFTRVPTFIFGSFGSAFLLLLPVSLILSYPNIVLSDDEKLFFISILFFKTRWYSWQEIDSIEVQTYPFKLERVVLCSNAFSKLFLLPNLWYRMSKRIIVIANNMPRYKELKELIEEHVPQEKWSEWSQF